MNDKHNAAYELMHQAFSMADVGEKPTHWDGLAEAPFLMKPTLRQVKMSAVKNVPAVLPEER